MAFHEGEALYLQGEDGRRYWFRYEPGMVKLGGMGTVDGSRFKDLEDGDSVEIVGNYNYDIESSMTALDDRIAIQGIAGILDLPKEVVRSMPPPNIGEISTPNQANPVQDNAA